VIILNFKLFKGFYYIFLSILIILFYTKDLKLFGNKFYKNIKIINNEDDILALVNKNNKLTKSYVPEDLIKINIKYANNDKYLRKVAKEAFEKLSKDALKKGYTIKAVSTYRSFDYQEKLFKNYQNEYGLKYALRCSAKPGHSEHQTGLAVDVAGSNNDYNLFEDSKEFKWMKENAHRYGFILRYPKGKEKITGFKYESWHYRYVGIYPATIIYNENLTLEEWKEKYG
jgi:LAS superfamily LD-carboxypeptidase LdcB